MDAMLALTLLFGALVGLALGLTGGGGSILAIPLLVYGLAVPPREAIVVSLASVGATALVGAVQRLRAGLVEVRIGLIFSVGGGLGAPVGAWIGGRLPEPALLGLFAVLMLVVAANLWFKATRGPSQPAEAEGSGEAKEVGPICQHASTGAIILTSRCAASMAMAGLGTGVLAGLFGVGGGFVTVPALVGLGRMPIHRAIATSLLVIGLVSAIGVAVQVLGGRDIPLDTTALFVGGGVAGMFLGGLLARRIAGPALQKIFAVAVVAVAVFVLARAVL